MTHEGFTDWANLHKLRFIKSSIDDATSKLRESMEDTEADITACASTGALSLCDRKMLIERILDLERIVDAIERVHTRNEVEKR